MPDDDQEPDFLGSSSSAAGTVGRFISSTERRLAIVRISFPFLVMLVFFMNNDLSEPNNRIRAVLELSVFFLAAGVSTWVLVFTRTRILDQRHTWITVSADAMIGTVALLTNTAAPAPDYPGVVGSLDVASVLLVIFSSILRVNLVAVLLASVLNVAGLLVILYLEHRIGLPLDEGKLRVFGGYVLGAISLSVIATYFARELLRRVAVEAARAERARGNVLSVLQDHHDHRSLLFDIRLNLEALIEREETVSHLTLRPISEHLTKYCDSFESTRDRTLATLRGLDELAVCDLTRAAESAAFDVEGIQVSSDLPATLPPVLFPGGQEGLRFQLSHLLRNARAGNGQKGAKRVWLVARREVSGRVILTVDDDGPGFDEATLGALGSRSCPSAKPGSWGLGLWLASRTLEAIGGGVRFANLPDGGARVSLSLPEASSGQLLSRAGRAGSPL